MKRKITFLIAALFALTLITQSFSAMGQTRTEAVYKQTTFNSTNNSANVNDYTSTWYNTTSGFRVDIANANNSNNSWEYIKMGRQKYASTGTIITTSTIDLPVKSVTLNIGGITTDGVTSIKLYTKNGSADWSEVGSFSKETGNKSVTITTPTANLKYKIEAVCVAKSNGSLRIDGVKFNVEQYTVSYDNGGGSGTHDSENKFRGEEIALPASNTFTPPTGCSFVRWDVTETTSGNPVAVANNKFTMPNANVTVTAVWSSGC